MLDTRDLSPWDGDVTRAKPDVTMFAMLRSRASRRAVEIGAEAGVCVRGVGPERLPRADTAQVIYGPCVGARRRPDGPDGSG